MEGRLFTCPIMKDKEYLPKYQEAFQSLQKTETLLFTTLTLSPQLCHLKYKAGKFYS